MLPLSKTMLHSLETVIWFYDRSHDCYVVAAGAEQRTFRALLRRGYVREVMTNGLGYSWYEPTDAGRELVSDGYKQIEEREQSQFYKAAESRSRRSLLTMRLVNG